MAGVETTTGLVLDRVASALSILTDLVRGDALLLAYGASPTSAVVRSVCDPATVPSTGSRLRAGDVVTQLEEPAILWALGRGQQARRTRRLPGHGSSTVQDVYPIREGARIVGALAIETEVLELSRQHRKSIVYRRALERLRRFVAMANVRGGTILSRLGECDGPMVITPSGKIVYISSMAEQLYRKIGYSESLLGRNVNSLRTDESAFFRAVDSGSCVEQLFQEGSFTWQKRAIPLLGGDSDSMLGRLVARFQPRDVVIVTVRDVTDETHRKRELRITAARIQEIHHRVKNNLQSIAALLRIQARRSGSPEVGQILDETIGRILSISYIHELLARQESDTVDLRDVIQRIVSELSQGALDPQKEIRFALNAPQVWLPTRQVTTCALVLNELLHNTVKHGFPRDAEGHVEIRIQLTPDRVNLEVTDEGVGLRDGFELSTDGSLGLQIVQTLVRDDLRGTFHLTGLASRGTKALVSFPRTG